MKYLAFLLLLVPANLSGCSISDVKAITERVRETSGPVCSCVTTKPDNVCYCGPESCER